MIRQWHTSACSRRACSRSSSRCRLPSSSPARPAPLRPRFLGRNSSRTSYSPCRQVPRQDEYNPFLRKRAPIWPISAQLSISSRVRSLCAADNLWHLALGTTSGSGMSLRWLRNAIDVSFLLFIFYLDSLRSYHGPSGTLNDKNACACDAFRIG
jgi:hypothetical protein